MYQKSFLESRFRANLTLGPFFDFFLKKIRGKKAGQQVLISAVLASTLRAAKKQPSNLTVLVKL